MLIFMNKQDETKLNETEWYSKYAYFQDLMKSSIELIGKYHSWPLMTDIACSSLQFMNQGILKGEVSLYHWPPDWLVWISLFCK
jgi:hypothetical protein